MGGGVSLLPEPDARVDKCVEILNLGTSDLILAYKLFQQWDKGKRGCLKLAAFYDMLGERKSLFGDSIFELIGIRNYQDLAFGEWLQALVTYCLFENYEILKFCFFILDREKNGFVELEELRMLVNMLYYIDPIKGPSGNTKVALDKLPVQKDGKVEFWEFELFHEAFPSLFYPASRLQVSMMQTLWGEKWWRRKKRELQDERDYIRRQQEDERLEDFRRKERMRLKRIRRKLGCCRYYFWPCSRDEMDKLYPKEEPPPAEEPEMDQEEALKEMQRKQAEQLAAKRKEQMKALNPETQEYQRYKALKDSRKIAVNEHESSRAGQHVRDKDLDNRRERLENRRQRRKETLHPTDKALVAST